MRNLKLISLVFAGWMRYLMSVGDDGKAFELSPDPLLENVRPYVAEFVVSYLNERIAGTGAVRSTLKKYGL